MQHSCGYNPLIKCVSKSGGRDFQANFWCPCFLAVALVVLFDVVYCSSKYFEENPRLVYVLHVLWGVTNVVSEEYLHLSPNTYRPPKQFTSVCKSAQISAANIDIWGCLPPILYAYCFQVSVKALIIGANIDIWLLHLPSYLHIVCVSKDFKQEPFENKCVIHNAQVLYDTQCTSALRSCVLQISNQYNSSIYIHYHNTA